MATTTPHQLFPVPENGDDPNIPGDMQALAAAIEKRVMGVYTSIADRDARITAPQDGQFAYVQQENKVYVFQDGAWAQYPPPVPTITYGTSVPSNGVGNNGDIFFRI